MSMQRLDGGRAAKGNPMKTTLRQLGRYGSALAICVVLASCGGDQGIQEPLLTPPVPSISPVASNDFAIVRGNYFLLASNCPQDATALRVAQEQEAVFMQGGFTFDEDPDSMMTGFVNEDGLIRFFGTESSIDPNCTAQVDGPVMRGSCVYLDGIEATTCRFVYDQIIEGDYQPIFNDCENDGFALEIRQDDSAVTLTNGFDYISPLEFEVHNGVIENGEVVFNIDVINGNGSNATTDQLNCEATVSGDLFSGICRDLTIEPTTVCSFGFENTLRTAEVDLNDDSLFPSPAITPDPTPVVITDISGTYAIVSNECEDDNGNIEIAQANNSLGFVGGFDYQTPAPDMYAGSMSDNSRFAFSVLGTAERAFCDADVAFGPFGISGFTGSCNVVDATDNSPVETCTFSYAKL